MDWNGSIATSFSGGTGTKEDHYKISTAEELAYLAKSVNEGNSYEGEYLILTNNIDLNHIEWTPIGNGDNKRFKGDFDGKGYTVSNMKITNSNSRYCGLFGFVDTGTHMRAMIENLTVEGSIDCDKPDAVYVGGIIGQILNSKIQHCFSYVNINMKNKKSEVAVGGIVGNASSNVSILNSANFGEIRVNAEVAEGIITAGGLVGSISNRVQILNCFNNSSRISSINQMQTQKTFVGGLIGYLDSAYAYMKVDNCFNATVNENIIVSTNGTKGNIYGAMLHNDIDFKVTNCHENISDHLLADLNSVAKKNLSEGYRTWMLSNGIPVFHTHSWSNDWFFDENGHWHKCLIDDCYITNNQENNGYAYHHDVYSTNQNVIMKSCECGYHETATLNAPTTNLIYDGMSSHEATIEYSKNWKGPYPAIAYKKDNQIVTETKETGIYTASLTIQDQTVSVYYTVSAADGSITNISDISKIYDGNAITSPTFDKLGNGNVIIEYKEKDNG